LNVFYMFYTLTFGTTLGIAMSENLLTMYFFYELLTLVTLPLVIHPMTKKSSKAGRTYLYLSLAGSAFAFIGLVLLISNTGSAEFVLGGIMNGKADNLNIFIYFLTFMGFGVKAVIFPVHIWLPQTTVAPTPVTALLHAVVVVKSGVFAIIRITYYNYGADYLRGTWAQTVCLIIVIFTILFGSVMSVKERHFKRRLAYSTISNLSYVLFGALLMTTAGFAAALLHMLFHAIIKICAFFCTGNVKYMTEREYCFQLDGLGKKMPLTFAAFTISAFALTGVPLFCGFVSKWYFRHRFGRHITCNRCSCLDYISIANCNLYVFDCCPSIFLQR
ncbi:MAG: proton-conducting transporter membrane subunit, partial [Clostridia bacterium]